MVVEQVPSDAEKRKKPELPGQVVLVLQGGGALGAYQVGVYEALHEAGIEPDWVIGASIGAINGAIIAGNSIPQRMDRLRKLWTLIEGGNLGAKRLWPWIGNLDRQSQDRANRDSGTVLAQPSSSLGCACATRRRTGSILFRPSL